MQNYTFSYYTNPPGSDQVWLHRFNCTGQEHRLIDCPRYNIYFFLCDRYDMYIAVSCKGLCSKEGDVRLVDSPGIPNEGRVMACLNGHWGTVCGHRWDAADAEVVCKQLGYSGMISCIWCPFWLHNRTIFSATGNYSHLSYTYEGNGLILLDDVRCVGSEPGLTDCLYDSDVSDCKHHNDIAVQCSKYLTLVIANN